MPNLRDGACLRAADVQQLLLSPALVDAALLKVAGWCQYKQQQRQQGCKLARGPSSSSSTSKPGRSTSSSRSSHSATMHSNGQSNKNKSSSSTCSTAQNYAAASACGVLAAFSELVAPYVHEMATAALGKAAVVDSARQAKHVLSPARDHCGSRLAQSSAHSHRML